MIFFCSRNYKIEISVKRNIILSEYFYIIYLDNLELNSFYVNLKKYKNFKDKIKKKFLEK
jgi:hypothetical protein